MRTKRQDKEDQLFEADAEWEDDDVTTDTDGEQAEIARLEAMIEKQEAEKEKNQFQLEQAVADDDFIKSFPNHAKSLAVKHIRQFFEGRRMHCGGPIPEKQLLTEGNIDMVVGTRMADAIDIIYDILESNGMDGDATLDEESEEAAILLEVCNKECFGRRIPKIFVGGIALLYLDFCRGIRYPLNDAE